MGMTYAGAGVDYGSMDPYKRMAQTAAATTDDLVRRFGFRVVGWSRGESAFLIEMPEGYLALVVEGLGTKNLVADELYRLSEHTAFLTGETHYDKVAQCTVAMNVNDLITLGARPICFGQYLAVGSSDWFKDEQRARDLIEGTRKACELAGCVWGPGETPALNGIIHPDTADLSGAVVGWISPKHQVCNPAKIRHGDAIVLVESSGIHANGLSLARKIAEKLPTGYLTCLDDGRRYGEALLDPTLIYADLVDDCLTTGIDIHYGVNITGHGWRKLMRAPQPYAYVIDRLPTQLPIFDFLQRHGPIDDREAYGTLNMGAGFALYVSEADVERMLAIATALGHRAFQAGYIEACDDAEKKVVIRPKWLEYLGSTLAVR